MNKPHGAGRDAGRVTVETTEIDPFTLRVTGVLDMDSAGTFRTQTISLLDEHDPTALVLSVEALEFVDSSGLRSFLEIRDETRRRNIPFRLRQATAATQKLLEMVGLDETLEPVDRDRT